MSKSSDGSIRIEGILLNALYMCIFELVRNYVRAEHYEAAYWAERRGRTRVEKEMRKLTEIQLNTREGFFVQPIAHVESCYRQCVGTPRQGALVPSSRATVVLTNNMSPEALDGLDEFSHVWLTFKFHLNTNVLKEAKAFSGVIGDSKKQFTFKAKIVPPMLKEKKGVLATRSPHRPNPIGVTLARIEVIDKAKRLIRLSACDLVDGTPILDIKPYVPAYDTVLAPFVPSWIVETIDTRNKVTVRDEFRRELDSIANKLREYKTEPAEYLKAVVETLEADVRSKFQTERRMRDAKDGLVVEVPFDQSFIRFFWHDERHLELVSVGLRPQDPAVDAEQDILDTDNQLTGTVDCTA